MRKVPTLLAIAFAILPCRSETLQYHEIRADTSGAIVPWHGRSPSKAYDHVIRLVWDFWRDMKKCPNELPYYMQHQVWEADKEDARGLGGDQISMALSSWNLLHGYTGDRSVVDNMVYMADYWLAHGMSAAGAKWPNLPYPYNTDLHSGTYDGDMRAGKGFLQPDKAGSFALELITLYKITENRKYLDAAVGIANSLAARVRPGDADNSPWPYRVHATTGEVHVETNKKTRQILKASYTTNWTGILRAFEQLMDLKQGDTTSYRRAHTMVLNWMKTHPLKTNKWGPFFEDIPTSDWSDTEINADTFAHYILDHPKYAANRYAIAKGIVDWTYSTFQNHEYDGWKVVPINEQTAYRVPGNSHTSRHASVELIYCELTHDCSTKEAAIRRLNWATYMVDADGKNKYVRDGVWLTDGYGDYVRHYVRSMAAAPELAPDDQNHLLRTTSVIQNIDYTQNAITYRKFDAQSTERFKLGAWTPKRVTGGTMQWDASTKVLTVRATSHAVTVLAK